ncbi:hypothetical protein ACC808_37720, partial [Rhizobium ruizarguesonis]
LTQHSDAFTGNHRKKKRTTQECEQIVAKKRQIPSSRGTRQGEKRQLSKVGIVSPVILRGEN